MIDLRSLRPLDVDTVIASVEKTNRMVTIEEGWPICSVGSELAAQVQRHAFDALDAPIEAVNGAMCRCLMRRIWNGLALPQIEHIIAAAKRACLFSRRRLAGMMTCENRVSSHRLWRAIWPNKPGLIWRKCWSAGPERAHYQARY